MADVAPTSSAKRPQPAHLAAANLRRAKAKAAPPDRLSAESPAPERPESALDWMRPDYDPIYRARLYRLVHLQRTPGLMPGVIEHYKTNPAQFIIDWGTTTDPRNAEIGQPVEIPFVLFPRQVEFIEWLHARWLAREDGLCAKSRDVGASWLIVAYAVWMWLLHPESVIGIGSRKEELVDNGLDSKSLFWKCRRFIARLPGEFRPRDYAEKLNTRHMLIANPANGATIVGEAGDNIGRGARTSLYLLDEAAYFDRAEAIDAALSMTSNCKIYVSSVNGPGTVFSRKRLSGKISTIQLHWRDDPRKDQAWYDKQKATLDPTILAQEVDIDENAATSDAWIPGDLVEIAASTKPTAVTGIGGWMLGVDAAHLGSDKSVIHCRRGRLNLPQIKRTGFDGPMLAGLVVEQCRILESASNGLIRAIVIELDGPGASCYDSLKMSQYADRVFGVHTGARLDDGRNYNLRAKLWRAQRAYLEDSPVSLADEDGSIKRTMCSLRYSYKNGLLLMQDKKQYRSMFSGSPDEADASVLSHYDAIPAAHKPLNGGYRGRESGVFV